MGRPEGFCRSARVVTAAHSAVVELSNSTPWLLLSPAGWGESGANFWTDAEHAALLLSLIQDIPCPNDKGLNDIALVADESLSLVQVLRRGGIEVDVCILVSVLNLATLPHPLTGHLYYHLSRPSRRLGATPSLLAPSKIWLLPTGQRSHSTSVGWTASSYGSPSLPCLGCWCVCA